MNRASNSRPWIIVSCFILLIAAQPAFTASKTITEAELVRRTQELYDAVASGDKGPWQKYFADDSTYSDEKGRTLDKTALVADISPLPDGYSGIIKVARPKSIVHGDTAVLSYDLDETETIFGQNLRARYHVTDTWLRRDDQWQIIASQAHRYYEDPALGRSDPKKFADYVGTYELAASQIRTVSVDGDRLIVERKGKKEELFPESSEIFFRKGVEGRILFGRGADGKVDALIDRRNNEDVIWRRKS
jgi:Domain of unknown function (DUF4440)/Domain of unknown function (DUF3471)